MDRNVHRINGIKTNLANWTAAELHTGMEAAQLRYEAALRDYTAIAEQAAFLGALPLSAEVVLENN